MKIVEDALISDMQSTSMKSFKTNKKRCNIDTTMPLATNLYLHYNAARALGQPSHI